jgi:hypothetical protein
MHLQLQYGQQQVDSNEKVRREHEGVLHAGAADVLCGAVNLCCISQPQHSPVHLPL